MRIALPLSSGLLRVTSQALKCTRFVTSSTLHTAAARGLHATTMSLTDRVNGLVEAKWLSDNLANVTVFDASWHMARDNRDPEADFLKAHIPGAQRFDIDAKGLSDTTSAFKHMLPQTPSEFGEAVHALGVSKSKPVVVYSTSGFVGAARAWWMFRLYGKEDVGILDGGFLRWQAEELPTESGPPGAVLTAPEDDVFVPVHRPELARDMPQMLVHSSAKDATVIDVRSSPRFTGTQPDPRPNVRSGHIPNSVSLPYRECVDQETGRMKPKDELLRIFEAHGIPLGSVVKKPVVTTCGSGVTAGIVALALYVGDNQDVAVYDGSWSEYGSCSENPVAVGDDSKKL